MFARVFGWVDDVVNPIVVKELRQAVQSRFLVFVLLAFFIIQLLGLGAYIFLSDPGRGGVESMGWEGGRNALFMLQCILMGACLLFLPINAFVRLASERSDVNVDLMFVTALSPRKIITGKLTASLLLALMIFSACSPFMVFTYFLRGVDLTAIFLVLGLDFLVVAEVVMAAIFLASVTAVRGVKVFLGLGGLFGLFSVYSSTVTWASLFIYPETGFWLGAGSGFWLAMGGLALSTLLAALLLYAWAIALISPPSSNRALPVRLCVAAVWLVSGAAMWLWSYWEAVPGPLYGWVMYSALLAGLCFAVAINERERWSVRVARTIPRWFVFRAPAFLLYSGSAGGVLFAAGLFVLTGVGALLWYQALGFGSPAMPFNVDEFSAVLRVCSVLFLYLYGYGMTAIFLRHTIFRGCPIQLTWLVVILLLAAGHLPWFISFLIWYRNWSYYTHYGWLLPNPGFAAYEVGMLQYMGNDRYRWFVAFATGWAALITLLNIPWLVGQISRFRRHEPPAVPQPAGAE